MNLVLFIYSMHSGGAERVVAHLANYWAAEGWTITVLTVADQSLDSYALDPMVQRRVLNLANQSRSPVNAIFNNFHRVFALRKIIKEINPDVVLSMLTTANILLALAASGLNRTVFIGSERTHPPHYKTARIWSLLRSYFYGRLDGVVALTMETAEWLKNNTKVSHIRVIPNPVSWPLASQEPVIKPPQGTGQFILLAVGRLAQEKDFGGLISIFNNLASDFKNWQLIIVGEGRERSQLEEKIKILGLEQRVLLPGRVGNIGDWYEMANLYVMSSKVEGFPNTLAEAMAYGLPAVSFDCDTGPRDIIRDGIDGFLIPVGDNAGMELKLRQLMHDEELRRQFAVRAVDIRDKFSFNKIMIQWERLFFDLEQIKLIK